MNRIEIPSFADNLGDLLEVVLGTRDDKISTGILQNRLIEELARFTQLKADQIAIFSRPEAAVATILDLFVGESKEILVMMPAETELLHLAGKKGLSVKELYGENPFMIDLSLVDEAVNDRCGLFYIANPTRPAGTVLGMRELEELLHDSGEAVTLLDENEFELSGIDCSRLIDKYPRLLILRRFPRLLGMAATPGEYLLGSADLIETVSRYPLAGTSSELSGTAAMAALRSFSVARVDNRTMRENMILFEIKLRGLGYQCHKTPFDYLLVRVSDPDGATAWLLSKGVSCRSLAHFKQLEEYLALSIGSDDNVARAVECMAEIPDVYRTD